MAHERESCAARTDQRGAMVHSERQGRQAQARKWLPRCPLVGRTGGARSPEITRDDWSWEDWRRDAGSSCEGEACEGVR